MFTNLTRQREREKKKKEKKLLWLIPEFRSCVKVKVAVPGSGLCGRKATLN